MPFTQCLISLEQSSYCMCVRQWSFKWWPTFLPVATQTFLTDIQSGKFEPKQDGLLLVPPCLLDWSALMCKAVWVAYRKMMGLLSDKGEWGVNCSSAKMNHQTSSCRSWRAVSWALWTPSDRAVWGPLPFCYLKIHWSWSHAASALPTGTFLSVRAETMSKVWQIYSVETLSYLLTELFRLTPFVY